MVFYLNIDVKTLIGRVLESRGMDFWESGMDLKHGDDIYDSFRAYQHKLLREYSSMADEFHFRVIDARRPVDHDPGRAAATGLCISRAGRLNVHSDRSACITSTRAARAAGTTDATIAAPTRTPAAAATMPAPGSCRPARKLVPSFANP